MRKNLNKGDSMGVELGFSSGAGESSYLTSCMGNPSQNTITSTQVADAIAAVQLPVDTHSSKSSNIQGDEHGSAGWSNAKNKRRRRENGNAGSGTGGVANKPVRGLNECQAILKSAPKRGYIHVSRLDPSTKADDVYKFSSQICEILQCETITSRHPEIYSSFKLTIPFENMDALLNGNLWPKGVTVRRFFYRNPTGRASGGAE